TLLSVGQRSDGKRSTSTGCIFLADECREALVGRNHVSIDSISNLLREALLVFNGDGRGILFGRKKKRIGIDNTLALHGDLFQKKADRHEFIFQAGAKNFSGLVENARNLVQTRYVVLIVLDGIERDGKWKVCKAGVDAAHLIEWHLVLFEVEVGDALLQHANQKIVRELVLIRKAGCWNRLNAF